VLSGYEALVMDTGGCFCGAIRYEVSGKAELQLFCFCADCRKLGGTDGYAGYMVPNENFRPTKGEPKQYRKVSSEGRTVIRHFCAECGSQVWGVTELGLTSVAAGTLDDPNLFQPTVNVFEEQAPSWARIPKHEI
jgi:hypothetical protein